MSMLRQLLHNLRLALGSASPAPALWREPAPWTAVGAGPAVASSSSSGTGCPMPHSDDCFCRVRWVRPPAPTICGKCKEPYIGVWQPTRKGPITLWVIEEHDSCQDRQ